MGGEGVNEKGYDKNDKSRILVEVNQNILDQRSRIINR